MIDTVKRILGIRKKSTGIKLIVSCERLEKRVALLENNKLEEYTIERETDRNIVGGIYKGKVRNIESGIKAMFVDIGFEKNAFLQFWDAIPAALDSGIETVNRGGDTKKKKAPRITHKDVPNIYPVGADILVQVKKALSATRARASPPISASRAGISCSCRSTTSSASHAKLTTRKSANACAKSFASSKFRKAWG